MKLQVPENDSEQKDIVITELFTSAYGSCVELNNKTQRVGVFGSSYFTKIYRMSITKTNQPMLFREITAVCSEIRTEYIGKFRSI